MTSTNANAIPSGCPMHAVLSSELTYDDYLKVPELLTLQLPKSDPAHSDELLFIVIHQAYELWFKLILNSIEEAIQCMHRNEVLRAHHFVKRVVKIMQLLVQQIHILETMSPVEFLQFRDRLSPASGFQSIQFRELEFISGLKNELFLEYFQNRPDFLERLKKRLKGPDLRTSYYGMAKSLGYALDENVNDLDPTPTSDRWQRTIQALLPIYQVPSEHLHMYLLSEALIEFDEYLALWRVHHVKVVERVIGTKQGTGGSSGVDYLLSTTSKKAFPILWELRTHLSK